MPVLITISAVTYLFKGKPEDPAGFLAPVALRNRLESLPEGPARSESLAVMDSIDGLAAAYDDATDTALALFAADVEKWSSTADDLMQDLKPADEQRSRTLRELIVLRQRLKEILNAEEWDQVFG